jgi:hypothetical protein
LPEAVVAAGALPAAEEKPGTQAAVKH